MRLAVSSSYHLSSLEIDADIDQVTRKVDENGIPSESSRIILISNQVALLSLTQVKINNAKYS